MILGDNIKKEITKSINFVRYHETGIYEKLMANVDDTIYRHVDVNLWDYVEFNNEPNLLWY